MSKLWNCPKGHRWEISADDTSDETSAATTCPICGLAGEASTITPAGIPFPNDELPPRPVRMPSDTTTDEASRIDRSVKGWAEVSGYEVLDELGRGGMGVVYKARQRSLNRLVALKMILAGTRAGPQELSRFRTEAEAIARLQHPHIIHIYDVSVHENHPCFSMEFVDGGNLAQRLAGGPLSPHQAAELAVKIAQAVHAAHERGIIHRDLKPANVLLMKDGTPKITDFGLAKFLDRQEGQTRWGDLMGTPNYMAPEQAEGNLKAMGPQTDVYALGAMLYEMLTGKPPFRGDNYRQTMKNVLFEEPEPPGRLQAGIPEQLETICLKCLRKDPAQRYASAQALADDLRQWLAGRNNDEPATTVTRPRGPKSNRVVSAGIALKHAGSKARQYGCTVTISFLFLVMVIGVGFYVAPRMFGPPDMDGISHKQALAGSWRILTIPSEPGEIFHRLAFPTPEVGYAASRQRIHKTEDGGKTWQKLSHPDPGRVYFLHFQDTQTGWLGTDELHFTADGGNSWSRVSLGKGKMTAVSAFDMEEKGWALLGGTAKSEDAETGNMVLFRRKTAGNDWKKLPLGKELKPYQDWFVGDLAVTGPQTALVVVFQGFDGGGVVLRTQDGGQSWSSTFQWHEDLYRVSVSRNGHGWLAGFGGKLWKTKDGGANWEPEEYSNPDRVTPTCLAFSSQGRLGIVPLWKGQVLRWQEDSWELDQVDLDYAMPDAAVVSPACSYVLGSDGKLAKYSSGVAAAQK